MVKSDKARGPVLYSNLSVLKKKKVKINANID